MVKITGTTPFDYEELKALLGSDSERTLRVWAWVERFAQRLVAEERERCTRIAESHVPGDTSSIAQQIAAGIRVPA